MKFIYFWGNTERNGEVTKACMSLWYDSWLRTDGNKGCITRENSLIIGKNISQTSSNLPVVAGC